MNENIKVILFDLGRVLMHIDFDAFPNGLGLITKEQRIQYDQAKIQYTIQRYETGMISTIEFLDSLYTVFNQEFSREEILNAFDNIIVKDNQEIIPFVENVRHHYRIAVLSNTCASHWDKVLQKSSVIKLFPDIFTSFHLGVMKPSSIIYDKVCKSLNVQPQEVIFIDDLKENVDAAIAFGMDGIVFVSIEQLKFLEKNEKNKKIT